MGDVDPGLLVNSLMAAFSPLLPWIIPAVLFALVIAFPMPGRGPRSSRRDRWRVFKYGARVEVMARADWRCEGALFFAWGRCPATAEQADHVFPWSKGGPTVVSNGQALCAGHNRRKANMTPPWWYVLALEKRRRTYFPQGASVRVQATMTDADHAARLRGGRR
ncbi:HNH endonuclease [Demequina phytophila]|uniref:HNH endonuclease n=1 Tax=Demequina phytophila TaxID=1638981 RepID=UPI000B2E8191|nr:HNH endonuclease signature motif containing protein [Demequina phytophila]